MNGVEEQPSDPIGVGNYELPGWAQPIFWMGATLLWSTGALPWALIVAGAVDSWPFQDANGEIANIGASPCCAHYPLVPVLIAGMLGLSTRMPSLVLSWFGVASLLVQILRSAELPAVPFIPDGLIVVLRGSMWIAVAAFPLVAVRAGLRLRRSGRGQPADRRDGRRNLPLFAAVYVVGPGVVAYQRLLVDVDTGPIGGLLIGWFGSVLTLLGEGRWPFRWATWLLTAFWMLPLGLVGGSALWGLDAGPDHVVRQRTTLYMASFVLWVPLAVALEWRSRSVRPNW